MPCLRYQDIPKVRVHKPKKVALSDADIDLLLSIPEEVENRNDIALRNKLYLAMLYTTGCRASELLSLTIHEIDIENMQVIVR